MKRHKITINQDHPDLPKYHDDALTRELEYTIRAIWKSYQSIADYILNNGYNRPNLPLIILPDHLPLKMLKEDFNYHLERYEAICDEIRYRKEMMP